MSTIINLEKPIKNQALDKMLEEMNQQKSHSPAEDAIHNWLCDQDDEELFKGILKEDRSINGSMKYCASKASEFRNGSVAMIDDQTVFGWVKEYFTSDKVEFKAVDAVVKTADASRPKKKEKPKQPKIDKKAVQLQGEQLSLLDML